ncbi:hypothetical protein KHC23_07590 [Ancylobacter dichloromethanicus]|uniref:Uncharacterized protein n=1 Tax=Ancylobacter dichloromethanicus TaxID=518825 RepID=A0A9W6MZW6_9HYPH|nr:hypothetical protein [Ancylobacter dichloromethanicus]MBS7553508.1 hypothetical protein [Ancylobacter dichloromethanicus]GLK72566.1 hypothetical protein GCM10017643_26820 [Ancylobacter dichloromethanicus]
MSVHTCDGRYHFKNGKVWKAPTEKIQSDGRRSLSIGFSVCRIEEHVSGDAGPRIAAALNHVEFGDPLPKEPST